MERFATPVPCLYSDGDQEQVKGQLGIYSALTFKRFQQLMTLKTGVPAAHLSAVLAYKRTTNGEEKRQKLNINESTNFGIVMRIHAKEIDVHFLISRKKSKRDRKGASWRKAADVEEENDVRDEVSVFGNVVEGVKAGGERKENEGEQNESERNVNERIAAERIQAERIEVERFEAERKEAEGKEAEGKEAERKEADRKEADRNEAERIEREADEALRKVLTLSRLRERASYQERLRLGAEKGNGQQIATGRRGNLERQLPAANTAHDEPISPVSTLPAVLGFFPPLPSLPRPRIPKAFKKRANWATGC